MRSGHGPAAAPTSARRRADLQDIAGVDSLLAEIDARAKELERRTAKVLAQNTP